MNNISVEDIPKTKAIVVYCSIKDCLWHSTNSGNELHKFNPEHCQNPVLELNQKRRCKSYTNFTKATTTIASNTIIT